MRHILCFSFSNVRICCLAADWWSLTVTWRERRRIFQQRDTEIRLDVCESCHPHPPFTESRSTGTSPESTYMPHSTKKEAHSEKEKGEREREGMRASALALYPSWGPALAAVCFKIIARCSQSTMDSGREGWGGRDFKSKHHRLIWAGSVHLPLGGRKEKNETKCKNMDAVFDWSASICNRLKCMSSNPDVHSHPEELHCWLLFIYNKKKKNHTFCMHGYARHKGRVHKGLRGSWGADCMEIKKKQE